MGQITIAVTSPIFSKGLERTLSIHSPSFSVRKVVSRGELSKELAKEKANILIVDTYTDWDGFVKLYSAKRGTLFQKVLVIGMLNFSQIRQLFDCGMNGFLFYSSTSEKLINALYAIENGQRYFPVESPQLPVLPRSDKPEMPPKITARENQVLQLIVDGYTAKEIAQKLFVSINTINTHRTKLFNKFNVNNMAGLVRKAIQLKFYPMSA